MEKLKLFDIEEEKVKLLDYEEKFLLNIYNKFCILTALYLTVSASVHFFISSFIEASGMLLIALIIIASSFIAKKVINKKFVFNIVLFILFLHFLRLLFYGGEYGSEIFWVMTFPLAAYLLLGIKRGTITILISFILLILVFIPTFLESPLKYNYPLPVKIKLIFAYTAVSIFSLLYEKHRVQYKLKIEKDRIKLIRTQLDLIKAKNDVIEISFIDSLTKCYNRHYLNYRLNQELSRIKRYNHFLSLIMCDIDHFKRVNDKYGHSAGDTVLEVLAELMNKSIRVEIDWVVRFGGDEFLIILPETDSSDACDVAERIRSKISSLKIFSDNEIYVTASFGIATINGAEIENITFEDIYKKADECLYEAKNGGRNKIQSTEINLS